MFFSEYRGFLYFFSLKPNPSKSIDIIKTVSLSSFKGFSSGLCLYVRWGPIAMTRMRPSGLLHPDSLVADVLMLVFEHI